MEAVLISWHQVLTFGHPLALMATPEWTAHPWLRRMWLVLSLKLWVELVILILISFETNCCTEIM